MLFQKKRLKDLGEEIVSLKEEIAALRQLIMGISTGNKGVPADSQQTYIQRITGRQAANEQQTGEQQIEEQQVEGQQIDRIKEGKAKKARIERIPGIKNIGFISDLKKDLGRKILALTIQEFFIFTEIYILEEKQGAASYREIAKMAGLTESSIRDYVARLIHRGIPIIKRKVNNKVIILRISPDLRSLFTLDSLVKLREIQDGAFIQDQIKDRTIEHLAKQIPLYSE